MNRLNRDKYKGVEITKNIVQDEGLGYWKQNDCFGMLCMATGTGKSRCGVLASRYTLDTSKDLFSDLKELKILLSVPTEKLRDINWEDEFREWGEEEIWHNNVTRTCYASLNKYKDEEWDLVILDECHRITPNNAEFFKNNKVKKILSLTATRPEDREKKQILRELSPEVFLYTLEEAEGDGLVAPFDIFIIKTYLDSVNKTIKAGNAKKSWMQTEQQRYDYLTSTIDKLRVEKLEKLKEFNLDKGNVKDFRSLYFNETYPKALLEQNYSNFSTYERYVKLEDSYEIRILTQIMYRKNLIENLPSKTALAKVIMNRVCTDEMRSIVFGGSIKQINELCGEFVHHSGIKLKKGDISQYDMFREEKINLLGVIKALNEGHNLPNVDLAIIVQINSKELDFIQRLGRIIRSRAGHRARMFVIVVQDTVDENWAKSALKSFNPSKITYLKPEIFTRK